MFYDEFKRQKIDVEKATLVCKQVCNCYGMPFSYAPSSLGELFEAIIKLPINNCFNLHLLHMLARTFKFSGLVISVHNYIKTFSPLRLSNAISSVPGVFQDIQVVSRDIHIKMQVERLKPEKLIHNITVGQLIGDKAIAVAQFHENVLKLEPSTQLPKAVFSRSWILPNYSIKFLYKHSTDHHVGYVYFELNDQSDIMFADVGKYQVEMCKGKSCL